MDDTTVIQYMDDPALAVDTDWCVTAANPSFEDVFGADGVEGAAIEAVFSPDAELADQHADTLAHYPDVGGIIEGETGHFDPDHGTIAALHDGRDPQEDNPDVGVFVDGQLKYFHLTRVQISEASRQLLIFRDITDVKDREQDLDFLLQILGRVLRHNLRNYLTVIGAQAGAIAEQSNDERAEMARLIREKSNDLMGTSEKTRLIQKAIESDVRASYDLQQVVRSCIADVREETETADPPIATDIPPIDVQAVPPFPKALRDTIENAVIYGGESRVEVTATHQNGWATLMIADNGPGVPDHELEALERRGETDLNHGSGAGLWLIYTTIQESRGDITFDTDDGTTVRIRLPLAN